MDLNGFHKYAAHILRPKNTKSGELELNNIGENAIITRVGMALKQTQKYESLIL